MDLFNIRNEAFKLANSKYQPGDTNFTKYSSIYLASTSNVRQTMEQYKNKETVLAMGGTGAHGFEAILNNSKKVDLFDVNELQRLFFEFMKTAIIVLKYDEFIKYFTLKKQLASFKRDDIKYLLSNELFNQLYYELPDDVIEVFGPLFDYFNNVDLICSGLFRFEHAINIDYLKRNISFYNEEEYNRLQKILRNNQCEINYYQADLLDIPNKFKDFQKYQLIVLDNILQYYENIRDISTVYDVNYFIDKKLSTLLSDDGLIQACYGYQVSSAALKMFLKIPLDKSVENNHLKKIIINKYMKEDICTQLIKKSDNYSYKFIQGVESENDDYIDNVVITYQKRRLK